MRSRISLRAYLHLYKSVNLSVGRYACQSFVKYNEIDRFQPIKAKGSQSEHVMKQAIMQ